MYFWILLISLTSFVVFQRPNKESMEGNKSDKMQILPKKKGFGLFSDLIDSQELEHTK